MPGHPQRFSPFSQLPPRALPMILAVGLLAWLSPVTPAQPAAEDPDVLTLEPVDNPVDEEDQAVIDEVFSDDLLEQDQPFQPLPPEPPRLSDLAQNALTEPERLEEGVLRYQTQLPLAPKVWIYLPETLPPTARVPLILISPATTDGYHGMNLTEADRAEHVPYAQQGMITAAFSTPGSLPENWTEEQRREAVQVFHASGKGVRSARSVLNYVVRLFPQVDPKMVFAAGHSSAGGLALTMGAYHSSLRGIVAYAPSTDLQTELGELAIEAFDRDIPGFAGFTRASSPLYLSRRISSPVFIFQAQDDRVIDAANTTAFVKKLRITNPAVKYMLVPEGGHYEGMLEQGIPAAIEWIDGLTRWRTRPHNQAAKPDAQAGK